MENITEIFGSNVFGDSVMKERLPKEVYEKLKKASSEGKRLDPDIAKPVAEAMKEWAIEKGATHFTHWFQPLTGITAEKHDSFISPDKNGGIIMEFSGKELIKGESDASSFPSGGLRATFEARGYTVWDSTSYAFVKDSTLCIPTAFCSYGGEALDKKAPLLRSMDAVNSQAVRIVKLFGNDDVKSVTTTVGPEQEYFLVDRKLFERRPDLVFCGRTLLGAPAPKGQEMDDHYYGVIKPRVAAFMRDLDHELWKLGILAKTEHNEAAPAQHELAPIFTTANISADHNQLTMEVMKKVADRHGLVCLLHEKPFNGVNGSGKHNNWAISTDTGVNLLDPGKTPEDNAQFLLFLSAVIKAVDKHQDLLRATVASAGNDLRLGANEAPPAIISIFLGDELTDVLESLCTDTPHISRAAQVMKIGVRSLPEIPKDNTDRNRTSPFAFTGNKFEFRMLGSSLSVSGPNTVLNTIVADVLKGYADRLETADDFLGEVNRIIKDTYTRHKKIIFNGDGYADEWRNEAEKRGLLNLRTTVDAVSHMTDRKNVELFARHGVLSLAELECRKEIALENYSKTIHIEALTLIDMIRRGCIPAVEGYIKKLCDTVISKKSAFADMDVSVEEKAAKRLNSDLSSLSALVTDLESAVDKAAKLNVENCAEFYKSEILPLMEKIRKASDDAESLMPQEAWPYPSYAKLMFDI